MDQGRIAPSPVCCNRPGGFLDKRRFTRISLRKQHAFHNQRRIQGSGPGARPSSRLFLDQTEALRAEKFFLKIELNGSVRSKFRKTGPPFEVVLFSRSDRLEFWLNGSRPLSPGALLAVLYFSSCLIFRPFRLSLGPTICPWVSEDGCKLYRLFFAFCGWLTF